MEKKEGIKDIQTIIIGDKNQFIFKNKNHQPIFFFDQKVIVNENTPSEHLNMFVKFLRANNQMVEDVVKTKWEIILMPFHFYFKPTLQKIDCYTLNVYNARHLMIFFKTVIQTLLKLEHHQYTRKFLKLFENHTSNFFLSHNFLTKLVNYFLTMKNYDYDILEHLEPISIPLKEGFWIARRSLKIAKGASSPYPYISVNPSKVMAFLSIVDPKLYKSIKSDLDYHIVRSY